MKMVGMGSQDGFWMILSNLQLIHGGRPWNHWRFQKRRGFLFFPPATATSWYHIWGSNRKKPWFEQGIPHICLTHMDPYSHGLFNMGMGWWGNPGLSQALCCAPGLSSSIEIWWSLAGFVHGTAWERWENQSENGHIVGEEMAVWKWLRNMVGKWF